MGSVNVVGGSVSQGSTGSLYSVTCVYRSKAAGGQWVCVGVVVVTGDAV